MSIPQYLCTYVTKMGFLSPEDMDINILRGAGPGYCNLATELLISTYCANNNKNMSDSLNAFEEAIAVWPVWLKWNLLRPIFRLSSLYSLKYRTLIRKSAQSAERL